MAADWQVFPGLARGFTGRPIAPAGRGFQRRAGLESASDAGRSLSIRPRRRLRARSGMQIDSRPKSFQGGEIGLALLFIFIAAQTIESAYAFPMGLGALFAAAGIFAIFQRFNGRAAERPPLEIGG